MTFFSTNLDIFPSISFSNFSEVFFNTNHYFWTLSPVFNSACCLDSHSSPLMMLSFHLYSFHLCVLLRKLTKCDRWLAGEHTNSFTFQVKKLKCFPASFAV
jgi:hypothetical protein